MKEHQYYVYILTNDFNTVLYTGVTNDLKRRVSEHKERLTDGFTKKYKINKLVYYEVGGDINGAIFREKQIKDGSRKKKLDLINEFNPGWKDLYDDI
jgi:putative endonuclease